MNAETYIEQIQHELDDLYGRIASQSDNEIKDRLLSILKVADSALAELREIALAIDVDRKRLDLGISQHDAGILE
ncbi:MAG: hypothetical protein PGN12_07425 [Sphingomonas phyllosphaerae]